MSEEFKLTRREFIGASAGAVSGIAAFPGAFDFLSALRKGDMRKYTHEALYYEKMSGGRVRCNLCPKHCITRDGNSGICKVRTNRGGKYFSLVYGAAAALHIDPIEKKPLYHFLPGTEALSIGTAGCNLRCSFCQNWEISQSRPDKVAAEDLFPDQAVARAKDIGAASIAGTYNEPIIFYEYIRDIALKARPAGIKTVMVSGGYINKKPLVELCKHLDGIKIDFKSISDNFYREMCGAEIKPVLDTLVTIKKSGVWLEIVNLVIPTKNDSPEGIRKLARFVKENLGKDVPVHFTRFYPQYKIRNLPPTPSSTLIRCREIAMAEGLKFVYLGNLPNQPGENTYCPRCKKMLLKRYGLSLMENNIRKGKCMYCGEVIPGVWELIFNYGFPGSSRRFPE